MLLSMFQAVQGLTRDNLTEHPSTINVLSRMNIYQEVVLAAVYRLLPALHVNFSLFSYGILFNIFVLLGCS